MMRKFLLSMLCLSAAALGATPAMANGSKPSAVRAGEACDAHYYDYLVGKAADQLVNVQGANYRVLPAGADGGKANPKRITVKVDKSNRIVELACG